MTPAWLHIVILRDGKMFFELSQVRAVEYAEKHDGRWVKVAFGVAHDLTGFTGNPVETARPRPPKQYKHG